VPPGGYEQPARQFLEKNSRNSDFNASLTKTKHTHSIIIQLRIKTHIGRGSAPLTWFPWLNFGIVVNSLLILNDLSLAFSPNSASKLHFRVLFSEYTHSLPKPFFLPHIGLLKVS